MDLNTRRNKSSYGLTLLSFLVLLSVATHSAIAVEKSSLIYGETARLSGYDPYTVHEASGQRLGDLMFDSLVTTDVSGRYVPSLASSWQIEGGGTSVLFNLNKNIHWHRSKAGEKARAFTADDVATTIRLLIAADSEIPNKERFNSIAGSEVINPHTVRIRLLRAMIDPLRSLTFKILPAHLLSSSPGLKRDSLFAKSPIGTGPYYLKKINEQGELLLEANDGYFKGKPKIPQIIMKSYADQSVMAQSLMFSSLDLITYVSPRDLGEIIGDKKLGVIPYDALSFSFFAMNNARGILKDRRVRQAISYAVNRQEMIDAFFQGKGTLISGPFPPTSWAYNIDVDSLPFDPAKSRALLKDAGLNVKDSQIRDATGKPVNLVFAVPLTGESEMIKRIVLAFQGYLADIGISMELQFMDWSIWKNRVLRDHDYDLTIASWSFDDASNITSLFHSSSTGPWGNNFVQYRNLEVDSLLTEANVTNDFDKRRAIYQKLHATLANDVPYTYLWTLMHHAAHNMRISGVRVEPASFFKHIANWQIDQIGE